MIRPPLRADECSTGSVPQAGSAPRAFQGGVDRDGITVGGAIAVVPFFPLYPKGRDGSWECESSPSDMILCVSHPMTPTHTVTQASASDEPTKRLAVLIDADNAQPAVIEALLEEVARFGEATVRRIYGDFTSPNSASWKKFLNKFSIKPVQQFAYTTGKNATDSTMIIDAMDLLYTRRFDGFCLVTSDSDFTGLAVRLREEGLQVFGFGEQKTPEPFRNACHKFIFTEVLRPTFRTSRS